MDFICVPPSSGPDSTLIASIVGALIGALLGALSAFLLSEYARKKEIERHKIQKMKDKAAEDAASLRPIQKYLVSIMTQSLMNVESAKDLGRGIISGDGKYAFSLSPPATYPTAGAPDDFINRQLFLYWESLGREIYAQNQSIASVSEYYDWLRKMSRELLFAEGSNTINKKAIEGDDAFIVESMKTLQTASELMYDKALLVMAHIHCYVDYRNTIDISDENSIKKMREVLEGFEAYEPTRKQLDAAKKKLKGIYSAEKMFHVEAY